MNIVLAQAKSVNKIAGNHRCRDNGDNLGSSWIFIQRLSRKLKVPVLNVFYAESQFLVTACKEIDSGSI